MPVSCVLVCGRSKHNSVYWQSLPFYAFGLGAASMLQGQRFSRPRTMPAYRDWVLNQGCSMPAPGELCPMLGAGCDWLQSLAVSRGSRSAVTCPIGCDQATAHAGVMALVEGLGVLGPCQLLLGRHSSVLSLILQVGCAQALRVAKDTTVYTSVGAWCTAGPVTGAVRRGC